MKKALGIIMFIPAAIAVLAAFLLVVIPAIHHQVEVVFTFWRE